MRSLAAFFSSPSRSSGHSFTYLIGGRKPESVETAVGEVKAALEGEGVQGADVQSVLLDVNDDSSIRSAVEDVRRRFNGLHGTLALSIKHIVTRSGAIAEWLSIVLINNAGIAKRTPDSLEDTRRVYHEILDTNVVSVANAVTAFAPLLRADGRRGLVVNISSARGSIVRLTDPSSPKTLVIPYSMSKVALNGLTLELAKTFDDLEFQLVNPGHCATGFNNYSGKRDPREGATAVVLLVERWLKEKNECGFWETEESKWELSRVPW